MYCLYVFILYLTVLDCKFAAGIVKISLSPEVYSPERLEQFSEHDQLYLHEIARTNYSASVAEENECAGNLGQSPYHAFQNCSKPTYECVIHIFLGFIRAYLHVVCRHRQSHHRTNWEAVSRFGISACSPVCSLRDSNDSARSKGLLFVIGSSMNVSTDQGGLQTLMEAQ